MAAERQELPAYGIGPRFQNRNRKEEIRNLGANNARAASGHAATAPQSSVTALVTFLLSALLSHISAGRRR
jgi:hypothetical protein